MTVAGLHLCRFQVLPEGQNQADLRMAQSLLSLVARRAPELVPDKVLSALSASRAGWFAAEGSRAFERYEQDRLPEALNAAVLAFRDAVTAVPPGHPALPAYLAALALSLGTRFKHTGDTADLDAAIEAGRQAADLTPPGNPSRPDCFSNLGISLITRFKHTGDTADLDAAIEAGRQAADLTPAGDPSFPGRLSDLGSFLRTRFEHTGNAADLDRAITLGQQAADLTPYGHPDRPAYLSNLGGSLRIRFEQAGDAADLNAAIKAGQQAADLTPPGDPSSPGRLSNLGLSLRARFEHTGNAADLDAAVKAGQQAADLTPPGHSDHLKYLSNLGAALVTRFQQAGDASDLDAAIKAGQQAADLTPPGNPGLALYLSILGGSLRTRFEHTGNAADLDAAIKAVQRAADLTPPGHPDHPVYLSNLGVLLLTRFEHTGNAADLDAATRAGQRAADLIPPGHTVFARCLLNLGLCLHTRFKRTGDAADFDSAIKYWREASETPTGRPAVRLTAASRWGAAAADAGRPRAAAEGYTAAVRLLPIAAWHGLDRTTRESQLEQWAGLSGDAAATAILDGRPGLAVELLEQGRSVLWTQALNLRGDLSLLRQEHPGLAARLDRIRVALDTPPPEMTALPAEPAPGTGSGPGRARQQQEAAEERRRMAREWDQILAQVRTLPGFRHFLAAIPYRDLKTAAAQGPVVIMNTSRYGCHALIIEANRDQPLVVSLPGLSVDEATDHADKMLDALTGTGNPGKDRHDLLDALDWLWDLIAEPVLTALGHTSNTATESPLPHVWWCPTGPLATMPIHAAGHHPRRHTATIDGIDCVLRRVISSYTPTLAALSRTRQPTSPSPVRQLTIGMPYTPGQQPLPAVPAEMRILASHFPPGTDNHQITGPKATRTSALAAISIHSWIHLACHASQLHDDPASSGFALHDGMLSITDLASQPTQHRDLAFLSACQTAAGSARLSDEAIHLAAAMQFLGYRHVIATMWTIADSLAPLIADTVYTDLTKDGHPDPGKAATALHQAVRELRLKHPADPQLWAPYIHLGG